MAGIELLMVARTEQDREGKFRTRVTLTPQAEWEDGGVQVTTRNSAEFSNKAGLVVPGWTSLN